MLLIFTTAISGALAAERRNSAYLNFKSASAEEKLAMEERLSAYGRFLSGLAAGKAPSSSYDWQRIAKAKSPDLPISYLLYIPKVLPVERNSYAQKVFPDSFADVYYPIEYISPSDGNSSAYAGFDIGSDDALAKNLKNASSGDKAFFAGDLPTSSGMSLVLFPVRNSGEVTAFVGAAVPRDSFFSYIIGNSAPAEVKEGGVSGEIAYSNALRSADEKRGAEFSSSADLLGNQNFSLISYSSPGMERPNIYPELSFGLGLLASLALGLLAYSLTLQREENEDLALWARQELLRREDEFAKIAGTYRTLREVRTAIRAFRPSMLQEISQILAHSGGYRFVWAGIIRKKEFGAALDVAAEAGDGRDYLSGYSERMETEKPVIASFVEKKIVIVPDISADPSFKPWAREAVKKGFASMAVVPLFYGEELLGNINLYSEEQNHFTPADMELLKELEVGVSQALYRLRGGERRRVERPNFGFSLG